MVQHANFKYGSHLKRSGARGWKTRKAWQPIRHRHRYGADERDRGLYHALHAHTVSAPLRRFNRSYQDR